MAVFDKTESLVMMPLCSAFTAADKTNALAAGNIAEMSLQQWVGTNVALRCCCMNMPSAGLCCCCMKMHSAGRAKFADSNAHEDKMVISKHLSKLCVPKLRRAAQGKVNCSRMTKGAAREKELLEPNADAAHDENEPPNKKKLRGEGAASRALPTISSGGV
eukprot:CAMPEP_0179431596 /NCGR_PEP_ID=MMETSP0799-20121207/16448_1 /TAXON_ID=46947 /ORGANISM="Geminigera cryophila, Strain CCMP2564" /LENGTH=160 /DNA_ID=CAMNT_0021208609 /DNA_START=695 /DNA_END=1178 /DNA_ORIENTATION=+